MTDNKMVNTYLYTRYERFWHWLQTALITILLVTGFEVDGLYTLLGYKAASEIHNFVGLTWLIAFALFVFWLPVVAFLLIARREERGGLVLSKENKVERPCHRPVVGGHVQPTCIQSEIGGG